MARESAAARLVLVGGRRRTIRRGAGARGGPGRAKRRGHPGPLSSSTSHLEYQRHPAGLAIILQNPCARGSGSRTRGALEGEAGHRAGRSAACRTRSAPALGILTHRRRGRLLDPALLKGRDMRVAGANGREGVRQHSLTGSCGTTCCCSCISRRRADFIAAGARINGVSMTHAPPTPSPSRSALRPSGRGPHLREGCLEVVAHRVADSGRAR